MGSYSIHNARLVLPDHVCRGGISWRDGRIREICSEDASESSTWNLQGDLLIPGLIDTHIHGAGGSDVMDASPESLENMAQALLRTGTTGFLPTTLSGTPEQLENTLQNVADLSRSQLYGAQILGVHMEGPFLAPDYNGAHAREMIWPIIEKQDTEFSSVQFFRALLRRFPGLLKIVTLAPERPDGKELIELCQSNGIIPSMGHTAASYEQLSNMMGWNVRHITHAFNAMPGIHHRQPGIMAEALLNDAIALEIIADGVHVHPAVVKLVLKNKPSDRVYLISDGTRALGMPEGEYELGGQSTIVRRGTVRLKDGTIAGSAYPLLQGLKTLVEVLQYAWSEAVRYVTLNPAQLLGLSDHLGSLEINKEATFVRLSSQFVVKQVWLQGNLVFERPFFDS